MNYLRFEHFVVELMEGVRMVLIDRQISLMNMLIKETDPKPVRYFAKRLNVSERTIYSDLEKVAQVSQEYGFYIEKKQGVGIKIHSTPVKKESNREDKTVSNINYGVKERRVKIIELLLFNSGKVTFQNLSDYFFVSKSSIHADLLYIKENFLNSTTVQLISDMRGTRVDGSEEQFQNTFVLFNSFVDQIEKKNEMFLGNHQQKHSVFKRYYGEILVQTCQRILYDFVKVHLEEISESYLYNVLNRLIVLSYRSSKGHHIEETEKIHSSKALSYEKNELLSQISNILGIKFSKGDIQYFNKHAEANKIVKKEIDIKFLPVIEKALTRLSEMLRIDFAADNVLKNQLAKHFPPMVYRLKNNIIIENPFLTQIKNEFGLMYDITWFVMSSFEEELGIHFTDKEIGFLMIYFQSALDRMQISKKVLIVCPTGITTSGLLLNRVKKILPPVNVFEVASFDDMHKINFNEIDFIISTAHIKVKNIPTLIVSPLINDDDMQNILNFYNSTFVLKEKDSKKKLANCSLMKLQKYTNENYIEFDCEYNTFKELINDVTDRLYKDGYVDIEYKNSLINREKMGGTNLPTGVAVPHGNPQYVKKTVIAVIVNRKPIKWNDDQNVRVVFFVCIAKEDIKNVKEILGEIYNLIDDREIIDQVFLNSNKKQFIGLLGGCIS